MIIQRCSPFHCRLCIHNVNIVPKRIFSYSSSQDLSQLLNVPKLKVDYLYIKHPVLAKLNSSKLEDTVNTIKNLGLSDDVLIDEPTLFNLLPVTLQNRFTVLQECGLHKIEGHHLAIYLSIMKKNTIQELRDSSILTSSINIENKLASYMSQWPTSLTTLIQFNVNKMSLYNLRLKIIQRYLELILDLSVEEFSRGLKTYPTIKHRPLQMINETLTLLQAKIMMPASKIKSNLYLVHANSDNLKQIIYNFRKIGGIDIKEILRMYPKLCMCNYSNMIETRTILKEYGIDDEAQMRCVYIYTLSADTVRERLIKALQTPEFRVYSNHPRFLKLIYYNKNATKRVLDLYYKSNKKCLTLNALSSSADHYKKFEKSPGDRSGKGKDLLYYLSENFGKEYSINNVRSLLKRHPFWINIPLVHVKLVYEMLSQLFSIKDIYENCTIILYPLGTIKSTLKLFNLSKTQELCKLLPNFEQVDFNKLNRSQILSLTLYLLEKNHYFSGNGVWTEEKLRETQQIVSSAQQNKIQNVN